MAACTDMSAYYILEDQPTVIDRISSDDVCQIADFVFDRAVVIPKHGYLELVDGQWFLHTNGNVTHLDGRWQEHRA